MSELYHYGVKGMKWGVRKDANKAYSKASNKLRKLDRKLDKLTTKADARSPKTARLEAKKEKSGATLAKLESKAYRKRYKADTAILFAKSKEKAARKAERKLARFEYKAAKDLAKYSNANSKLLRTDAKLKATRKKAIKWYQSMEKTFANTYISDMSPDDVALGMKYAEMVNIRKASR